MSNEKKKTESVRQTVGHGQTNQNVSQERELLCICPGNKECHFEARLTEHGLCLFQFQIFQ